MATARNGRARGIPLVQRLSFATRLASGWTVAATGDDAKRHRPSLITSHQSRRLAFGVWRLAFGVWRLAFGATGLESAEK
jgi:hypothetical protein